MDRSRNGGAAFHRSVTALAIAFALLVLMEVQRGERNELSITAEASADQETRVNPDAQLMVGFNERIKQYVALHQKLEATIPPLPTDATADQIDSHQRALERLIQRARANAKPGDVFTKETRALFRRNLFRVFSGPEGPKLKAAIMDENPGPIRLTVNGRYPDGVPLPTVPPRVLEALPKLPEELEYRFIGDRLILIDVHAHTIVDIMDDPLRI